jgi:hypothetical protein
MRRVAVALQRTSLRDAVAYERREQFDLEQRAMHRRAIEAVIWGMPAVNYRGMYEAPTRIVAPDGRPWSGDQPRGLDYWVQLHDIYQCEVVDERDRFYLAMLRQLGIEPGRPFEPDDRLRAILTEASAAGELMAQANTFTKRFAGSRYRPDRQWDTAIVLDHPDQRGEHCDQMLERASWFSEAVSFSEAMKSQTPGVGQAYLGAYTDAERRWLDGARDYTVHVVIAVEGCEQTAQPAVRSRLGACAHPAVGLPVFLVLPAAGFGMVAVSGGPHRLFVLQVDVSGLPDRRTAEPYDPQGNLRY